MRMLKLYTCGSGARLAKSGTAFAAWDVPTTGDVTIEVPEEAVVYRGTYDDTEDLGEYKSYDVIQPRLVKIISSEWY